MTDNTNTAATSLSTSDDAICKPLEPQHVNGQVDVTDENPCDDSVVCLDEVVEEEERLHAVAKAVLGAADESACTYIKGYMKRQALYSCITCKATRDTFAGICFACSLKCHDGHELVELYTKRNFRCDCGNEKFNGAEMSKCQLFAEKAACNERNRYNHNFEGLYCVCNKPYPDQEDSVEDEMVQCVVCEDWFHTRHLELCKGSEVPDEFFEMICQSCAKGLPFLFSYNTKGGDTDSTNVEPATLSKSCRVEGVAMPKEDDRGAIFWSGANWREELCRCSDCLKLYESHGCAFLLDKEDTVEHYEKLGERTENVEINMDTLTSHLGGRTQLLEVLHGYNNMKDQFKSYLQDFVGKEKVVSKRDIDEFFEGLQAQKRPRLELFDNCGL